MNFGYPPLVEKLAPETVRVVSAVVEAVIEGGDTLLIEGAGVAACTVKLPLLEVCPSLLTTCTVHVPTVPPLFNW